VFAKYPACVALLCFAPAIATAQGFVYPIGDATKKPTHSLVSGNGYVISQDFHNVEAHSGVDLANGSEGGEVRAVGPGHVTLVGHTADSHGWGNIVVIQHDLPEGTFYSLYAHMQEGSLLVKQGDPISSAGMPIGKVDCTGNTRGNPNCPSNHGHGAHLHFGVKLVNEFGCGYITKESCHSGDSFDNYVSDPLQFIADHTSTALLVSSNGQVLKFDPITGLPLGRFASGGGLNVAQMMAIGPDGNLYVASSNAHRRKAQRDSVFSLPSSRDTDVAKEISHSFSYVVRVA
jgi:murein DD-endopeptidase MepM/ murein hydrolase activator NlpD